MRIAKKSALLLSFLLGSAGSLLADCWYVIDHYKQVCSDCQTCNWNPQPCIQVPVYRRECDDTTRGKNQVSKAQESLDQAQAKSEAAHQASLLALEKALSLLASDAKSTPETRKLAAAEAQRALAAERRTQLETERARSAVKEEKSPFKSFHAKAADATAAPLDGNCIGGKECPRKGFSVCCPTGFPYYSGCDELCHTKKPWDCGDVSDCRK
jgi:hypothetical protein